MPKTPFDFIAQCTSTKNLAEPSEEIVFLILRRNRIETSAILSHLVLAV